MGKEDDIHERISVLLNYWIEHNREHGQEYQKWIQAIKDMGYAGIAEEISEVVELTETIHHHFIHAGELLDDKEIEDNVKKPHEPAEHHEHHHHEHITFHIIGVIHTPYHDPHPKNADEKDGEFFLEIYHPYLETLTRFEPGVRVLVVYVLKEYERHISTGHPPSLRDTHGSEFVSNPIDIATVTIQSYEQEKMKISPVPVADGTPILLLKQ